MKKKKDAIRQFLRFKFLHIIHSIISQDSIIKTKELLDYHFGISKNAERKTIRILRLIWCHELKRKTHISKIVYHGNENINGIGSIQHEYRIGLLIFAILCLFCRMQPCLHTLLELFSISRIQKLPSKFAESDWHLKLIFLLLLSGNVL